MHIVGSTIDETYCSKKESQPKQGQLLFFVYARNLLSFYSERSITQTLSVKRRLKFPHKAMSKQEDVINIFTLHA